MANQGHAGAGAEAGAEAGVGAGASHVTHMDMFKLVHLLIPQWTDIYSYDFTE